MGGQDTGEGAQLGEIGTGSGIPVRGRQRGIDFICSSTEVVELRR